MNVSRADGTRPVIRQFFIATFGILAFAWPAAAQAPLTVPPENNGTVSTRPEGAAPRALTPRRLSPAVSSPSQGTTPNVTADQPTAPGGIQVTPLSAVDPDSVGAISATDGGFGADVWAGTPAPVVIALLEEFPIAQSSRTLRKLSQRLLMSSAEVPTGQMEIGSFIARRVSLLAEMGDLDGATRLLDVTPSRISNEHLAWTETMVRFLADDNVRACAIAGGRIAETDSSRWQKAFIFCQILSGEKDKAALGLSLMHELDDSDEAFFQLAEGLISGNPAKLESFAAPSPLTLAMARAAKVSLPDDALSSNRPRVWKLIATDPKEPIERRLDAAERAVATGSMPVQFIRDLYREMTFAPEELSNPISAAAMLSPQHARALLYRAAAAQAIATAKAEAAAQAFALSRSDGRFSLAARIFEDVIAAIPPSPEFTWFAPDAIRVLVLSETPASAGHWSDLLQSSARFRSDDAAAARRIAPLMRIAGIQGLGSWSDVALKKWWEDIKPTESASDQGTLLFTLLDAVGDSIPPTMWMELLNGSPRDVVQVPRAPWWLILERASASGRIGESVLASVVSLGDGGVVEAAPIVLHRVITALRAIHLDAEARAIALEAAVEAGL